MCSVARVTAGAGLGGLWSSISGLRHELVSVLEDGDRAVVEARVHSTRHDGSQVVIPAATMIDRRDGLVASQRVYLDLAPLQAS